MPRRKLRGPACSSSAPPRHHRRHRNRPQNRRKRLNRRWSRRRHPSPL
jgi:hypothetical protein